MKNDPFIAALYLLSSLLQADAAILGFGAIFVIYRLQTIAVRGQNAISQIALHGPDLISKLTEIQSFGTITDKIRYLKNHPVQPLTPLFFDVIMSQPTASELWGALLTVCAVALHMCCCGFVMFVSPHIDFATPDKQAIVLGATLGFILVVVLTIYMMWSLLRLSHMITARWSDEKTTKWSFKKTRTSVGLAIANLRRIRKYGK